MLSENVLFTKKELRKIVLVPDWLGLRRIANILKSWICNKIKIYFPLNNRFNRIVNIYKQ
jgi:hypothetical protein